MNGVFREYQTDALVILLVEIEMRFTIVRGGVVVLYISTDCEGVVSGSGSGRVEVSK
jgi:hypothetical protein